MGRICLSTAMSIYIRYSRHLAISRSTIFTQNDSTGISYRQQSKVQKLTLLSLKGQNLGLIYFKNLPKMTMSEKCRSKYNNNYDNPLTSRRADGGKNQKNYPLKKSIKTFKPLNHELKI